MAKKMELVVTLRSLPNAPLPFLILLSPILPSMRLKPMCRHGCLIFCKWTTKAATLQACIPVVHQSSLAAELAARINKLLLARGLAFPLNPALLRMIS